MALPRVSPPAYRRATLAALVLLTIIVVTGAAVRLTDSGLGCADWPQCSQHTIIGVSSFHERVEQGNRLFTGLVALAVAAAVLGSVRRDPRRRDLVWLSWGLVAGVVGQIVVGGIAVKTHLNPGVVACHFLVSIALITDAVVLFHRAGREDTPPVPAASGSARRLGNAVLAAAGAVILAGTVVTGTGPHGGDAKAPRFQLVMTDVARVHSLLVFGLVALTVGLGVMLRRENAAPAALRAVAALLAIEVAQAAVGYTQYFTGVPALLVAVHVIGALSVWIGAMQVRLSLWSRPPLFDEIRTVTVATVPA